LRFTLNRLHRRCFPAKLTIFFFTKIPYEFLHCFHRSWSFVSGQQCRGFRISGQGFSTALASPVRATRTARGTRPLPTGRPEDVVPQWRTDAVPHVIIFVVMPKMILLQPE